MAQVWYVRDDMRSSTDRYPFLTDPPNMDLLSEVYYEVFATNTDSFDNFVSEFYSSLPGMYLCPDCWDVFQRPVEHTIKSHPVDKQENDFYIHIRELRDPKTGDLILYNGDTYAYTGVDWEMMEGEKVAPSQD